MPHNFESVDLTKLEATVNIMDLSAFRFARKSLRAILAYQNIRDTIL